MWEGLSGLNTPLVRPFSQAMGWGNVRLTAGATSSGASDRLMFGRGANATVAEMTTKMEDMTNSRGMSPPAFKCNRKAFRPRFPPSRFNGFSIQKSSHGTK